MTPFDRKVLKAVTAAIQRAENDLRDNPLSQIELAYPDWCDRCHFAEGYGVRIDYCRWAGLAYSDETVAKKWQRAVVRLAKAGLVERIALPGRTRRSHIRLVNSEPTASM